MFSNLSIAGVQSYSILTRRLSAHNASSGEENTLPATIEPSGLAAIGSVFRGKKIISPLLPDNIEFVRVDDESDPNARVYDSAYMGRPGALIYVTLDLTTQQVDLRGMIPEARYEAASFEERSKMLVERIACVVTLGRLLKHILPDGWEFSKGNPPLRSSTRRPPLPLLLSSSETTAPTHVSQIRGGPTLVDLMHMLPRIEFSFRGALYKFVTAPHGYVDGDPLRINVVKDGQRDFLDDFFLRVWPDTYEMDDFTDAGRHPVRPEWNGAMIDFFGYEVPPKWRFIVRLPKLNDRVPEWVSAVTAHLTLWDRVAIDHDSEGHPIAVFERNDVAAPTARAE